MDRVPAECANTLHQKQYLTHHAAYCQIRNASFQVMQCMQVDILDLTPRPNPSNNNRTYGSNAAASWGYQFRSGFLDGVKREVVTIYEIIKSAAGRAYVAVPDYTFK